MTTEVTFEQFAAYIANRCKIPAERITMESSFTEDLGIDSLSMYSLMTEVETEFGVSFQFEDIIAMNIVGNVFNQLGRMVKTEHAL